MKKFSKQSMMILAPMLDDLARRWVVGDACATFKGRHDSSIAAIEGDVVKLADGTSGHISRLRSARGKS